MLRWSLPVLVMAVIGALQPACSKNEPEQRSAAFSCDLLQRRAETCAPQTLARVQAKLATRTDHAQQLEMFKLRFNGRLAAKKTKAQCEKFQADEARAARVDAMRACHAKDGCEAFADCMLQL